LRGFVHEVSDWSHQPFGIFFGHAMGSVWKGVSSADRFVSEVYKDLAHPH
jgi:hypothetical protein